MKRLPLLAVPGKHRRPRPAAPGRARLWASAVTILLVCTLAGSSQALPATAAATGWRPSATQYQHRYYYQHRHRYRQYVPRYQYRYAYRYYQHRYQDPVMTVRPGDTLATMAVRYCHAARYWTGIYAANSATIGKDPGYIRAGQRLLLPRCATPDWPWRLVHHPASPAAATAATARTAAFTVNTSFQAVYSYAGLEGLWESAGGPAWAAPRAAQIALCESGGRAGAFNPSGATGIWQILGAVVPGNLDNPYVNALNAVAKFRASGDTFAQWVCQ